PTASHRAGSRADRPAILRAGQRRDTPAIGQACNMISFAQNYEDVILERIFRDKERGFYVDVGACHPVYESVTHHFHLRGWRGVKIEPQPQLFQELRNERPQDINLNLCAGSNPGRARLYLTRDEGTSTLDRNLGRRYAMEGRLSGDIEVEVRTL